VCEAYEIAVMDTGEAVITFGWPDGHRAFSFEGIGARGGAFRLASACGRAVLLPDATPAVAMVLASASRIAVHCTQGGWGMRSSENVAWLGQA